MGTFDRILRWRPGSGGGAAPEGLVPASKLAARARRDAASAPPPELERDRELLAERDRLTERFTLLQADLGGVFYEMAIRDHVRMDVLTGKAAELQRVDQALQQVERALRGEDGERAGSCPACAALFAPGARFCASCGQTLTAPQVNGVNGSGHVNGSSPGSAAPGPPSPGGAA